VVSSAFIAHEIIEVPKSAAHCPAKVEVPVKKPVAWQRFRKKDGDKITMGNPDSF